MLILLHLASLSRMLGALKFIITCIFARATTMLLFDRKFGTPCFDPLGGGDSIMFQHMFGFFLTSGSLCFNIT
ncbi:unnamed protein product [Protopolystoma xenopodis]|uniref:Cytochrome c oxidase subunit 1 n=1 Tax=Protopolystoma xenopodis TaxID=117903 RepID=A0A448WZ92_9PLAT|nr:unnamed protein product [Protopolystoma xenopodis]